MKEKFICHIYKKNNDGIKLSRREKKWYLGKKLTKSKIRRKLETLKVVHHKYPEQYEFPDGQFCPNCGCERTRTVYHYVEYPEVWWQEFCARCGLEVGGQDNSAYAHVLSEYVAA